MAGAGDIDDVYITLFDQAIQMKVDEILARRSSPVSKQTRLDLLGLEGRAKQGVLKQIDLADAQIVCRAPVPIHFIEHVGR